MRKTMAAMAALVMLGTLTACKAEVDHGCKGGTETVIGKRIDEGYWALDVACANGGTKIYKWEPKDGNPGAGIGPDEWERYSKGDVYEG